MKTEEFLLQTRNDTEEICFRKDAWLRKKGWNQTSSTPGSLWLWKKDLPGFGTMYVNQDSALHMQSWIDEFSDSATPAPGPTMGG